MNKQEEPRTISILGSTGSIGSDTISVLQSTSTKYRVLAITAHESVELLAQQAYALEPEFVVIANKEKYRELKRLLSGTKSRLGAGDEGLLEAASLKTNWTMAAIVGAAGLKPVLTTIAHGGTVALANKESLVCAGELLAFEAKKSGATLLPVDSEHNGVFQSFDFNNPESVEKIYLTASGGPFLDCNKDDLQRVTPEQAVKHPNWDMGPKISVDSATMMNKALEVIEAFHLFPININQISVLIHPESIIHSMVSYWDGSFLAHLGNPDMKIPIAYALSWPRRMPLRGSRLDITDVGKLTFRRASQQQFPALRLANEVLEEGGGSAIVMNAANEVAVQAFLQYEISFISILKIVEASLARIQYNKADSIEEIMSIDNEARRMARNLIAALD
ncbi:MAG: 1-deoxy-D-xylulose-5-phosphate reductoisomerase [Rhodospirillaceae bacterium]|nr:1-deoxy-D-xylulose-5-phosphate reductoisomerase [Rhodospirillaceae bacterium]